MFVIVVVAAVVLVVFGAVVFVLRRGQRPEPLPSRGEPAKLSPATPAPRSRPEEQREPASAGPEKSGEPTPAAPAAEKPAPAKASEPASAEARAPEPGSTDVEEDDAGRRAEAERPPHEAVAAKLEAAPAESSAETRESIETLRKGLATTRGGFIARLAQLFGRRKEIDPTLLDEVQAVLLSADIGPRTADKMLEGLRAEIAAAKLHDEAELWASLRAQALEVIGPALGPIVPTKRPTVIIVVGVNGVGKTTTIGKLASRYQEQGRKVVLAAGDTFRAAAVLQLEVWGKRVGCEVVKGKDRADPGAVIFDAIKKGIADGADVVLADTAGRLHTKSNLMEELKKVVRTAEKALERPIDEVLLVLDATTGQNAIQQAQLFREAIRITGIVLTKLDGTAKGGVVLGVANEHGIPVRYVGIGERVEDLRVFAPDVFVSALFEKPEEPS